MGRRLVFILLVLPAPIAFGADRGRPVAAAEAATDEEGILSRLIRRLRATTKPAPPAADGTARIVSWNIQAFGRRTSPRRRQAIGESLSAILGDASRPVVFAAEEISNQKEADVLRSMLPGRGWTESFEDTSDAMDNGLFAGPGASLDCSFTLEGFQHPPRVAHVTIGDADFTLIAVHLTYRKGDAAASDDELSAVLKWAQDEAAKPGADPDVVIAGDFNLATRSGKELSARAREAAWTPLEDTLSSGWTPLVDEPTSRGSGPEPVNNYDHFVVSDSFRDRLLVAAGRLDEGPVVAAEAAAGSRASDHFPIAMTLRTTGGRDGAAICRR